MTGEEISAYFYGLDRSFAVPNRMRLTAEWLLGLVEGTPEAAHRKLGRRSGRSAGQRNVYEAYQTISARTGTTRTNPSTITTGNASCLSNMSSWRPLSRRAAGSRG